MLGRCSSDQKYRRASAFPCRAYLLETPPNAGIHAPCGLDVAAEGLFEVAVYAALLPNLHGAADLRADPSILVVLVRALPRIDAVGVVGVQAAREFMIERDLREPRAPRRFLPDADADAAD